MITDKLIIENLQIWRVNELEWSLLYYLLQISVFWNWVLKTKFLKLSFLFVLCEMTGLEWYGAWDTKRKVVWKKNNCMMLTCAEKAEIIRELILHCLDLLCDKSY